MLKKINRLTKQKDFDHIYKTGKSSFSATMGIKISRNELKNYRFGIVVSTKVSKKAVERNKIKRQIRTIIKEKQYKTDNNYDIIIITLPTIKGKKYNEIKKDLNHLFKKVGL